MAISPPQNHDHIESLLEVMRALRHPEDGCPWDLEQSFETIAPYTAEEAYEVADAIERGDMEDLCEELGDLLLQVAYHAQLANEVGAFSFADVTRAIVEKMIRRHPHVFANEKVRSADEQIDNWEAHKKRERQEKQNEKQAFLADVPKALPALMRAQKLQKRASSTGFDWKDITPIRNKILEELDELDAAIQSQEQAHIEEEMGDILFTCVNLSRHLGVDSETALHAANQKFMKRFSFIEEALENQSLTLGDADLSTLDRLWNLAKQQEPK